MGTREAFAERVWPEILRQRFDQARSLFVLLGDGADWLDMLGDWLPIKVLRFLDLYHAKKRVAEVASALYADDEVGWKRWGVVEDD